MRVYWFTSENSEGECVAYDHHGNIRGARKIAQKIANELQEDVYINLDEDIYDVVFPEEVLK